MATGSTGNRCWPCRALRSGPRCKPRRARACGGSSPRSAPGQAPPTVVGPEQIRLLVYTAISSGSRGLLFLSDSSLEAQDGETRQRVMTLQLLNLELETIEPWAAGGNMDATAEMQPAAGQRRDPPRRSGADRHADVAGPRLAMRGPAGRGQSAEPHPAGHSRIGAISSNCPPDACSRSAIAARRAARRSRSMSSAFPPCCFSPRIRRSSKPSPGGRRPAESRPPNWNATWPRKSSIRSLRVLGQIGGRMPPRNLHPGAELPRRTSTPPGRT